MITVNDPSPLHQLCMLTEREECVMNAAVGAAEASLAIAFVAVVAFDRRPNASCSPPHTRASSLVASTLPLGTSPKSYATEGIHFTTATSF